MRKKEFVNLRIRTLINKKNKNLNTKDKYWTYIYNYGYRSNS